ncbi:menaquinol--cytochrome-c reductase (cytochrome bc complex) cytochrome b/c subunit [Haloferax mucosum ATCC BAA-1512]|uniref:Menaquinol--cytochrome-c reductase (Cytochrome bc complex) cytochrome b/c subunit n=1 Tax=Haloferax mucosum ATCC BAA-1512 TaxID=662479 RepID=M0I4N1_9EURY|nr:cytochrome bc complex cytochrome b subunit [Haloferax mucosum]ELZ91716.1 menaquinol--cytochrome-c reductase (cytochrome bc complex) cytochrome b/c subunit [Haloferax mucosum ATCC BAA-1512]
MSDNEPENEEIRTDGTGIVAPDNETPTWSERKARKTGLSRLTYEYFERARREDQDLRTESDYVERDVLAFPTWPHETVRNLSIASFFVGMILFLSATMPPHIGAPANPSNTPSIILPDWYLYWSFGLLKLNALNPELAILGGQKLMADRTYGVLANGVVVGAIAIVPFLNKGSARRPVEQPFWAAVGVFGVVLALTLSLLAIKNLMPMNVDLLFDLTFFLPVVFGTVTYAVLKTMREGYMYDLNRRYYRLRPPK